VAEAESDHVFGRLFATELCGPESSEGAEPASFFRQAAVKNSKQVALEEWRNNGTHEELRVSI
jgi:hypothetical protein